MSTPVDDYVSGAIGPGALGYNAAELAGLPVSVQSDIEAVLDDRNDVGAWASLGFASLSLAAETLPAETLQELRGALSEAIGQTSATVGTALDQIGGLPIIGQAVEFLWEYVGGRLVDEAADVAAEKVKRSRQGGENARMMMLGEALGADPNAMVFAPRVAELLFPYWKGGREYRFRPAFRPCLKASVMWGYPPSSASGLCFGSNAGALYRITGPAWRVPAAAPRVFMPGPTNPNLYWRVYADRGSPTTVDDAWEKVSGKGCDATTVLSALYYPFLPSQRRVVDYNIGSRPGTGGVNRQLMYYQAKLLSDPSTNLAVDLKRAQRLARDFATWWNEGARARGIEIDARRRRAGDWTEGDPEFYLERGIVRVYPGAKRRLTSVGVPSPDDPSRLITAADRNAVVGQTLALARARAEMLRNTGAMRSVLQRGTYLDSGVRDAVEFSAEQSGLLPRKKTSTRAPPVKRGHVDLGALKSPQASPTRGTSPGSSSSSSSRAWPWVAGGVIAAVGGALAWKFRPWERWTGSADST